jgi:hypothetical protein
MSVHDDVETFAALSAELAHAGDTRAAILAREGLTEARWEEIDARWRIAFDEAEAESGDGIPKLITRYTKAFAAGAREATQTEGVLAFETFCEILATLESGGDARGLFERFGTTLPAFLAAQAHWVKKMTADPSLLARFSQRRSVASRR